MAGEAADGATRTSRWCRSPGRPRSASGSCRSRPATVKRVHLELGGKAPFVVFDDADLDAAVHGAVAGALINTGQDCTAATRAYVQRPLYDAFVARRGGRSCARSGSVRPAGPGHRPGPAGVAAPARARRRLRRPGRAWTAPRSSSAAGRVPGRPGAGALLRADADRRRRAGLRDRPGRGVRTGARRPAVRLRRRGPPRWPTTRRYGLAASAWTRDVFRSLRGQPGDPGRLRLGQRPHPDRQRDAARGIPVSQDSART